MTAGSVTGFPGGLGDKASACNVGDPGSIPRSERSPSPGDLSDPGIEPRSPTLQADALSPEAPGKPNNVIVIS